MALLSSATSSTHRRRAMTLPLLSALSIALPVQATNGYFAHGYGVKSQGMAGVGYALPQDGLASAFNPAGIAALEDRLDLGATGFFPRRSADRSEEHTSELQSLMRISYAVFCLKKKKTLT